MRLTLYDTEKHALQSIIIDEHQNPLQTFTIENPDLWWPRGYGDQALYTVVVEYYYNNAYIDNIHYTIGLRTVELNRAHDKGGSKFEFIINGRPIFIKGTNMIIEDAILNQNRKYDLSSQIEDCIRANINCIRVWGGAYYPSNLFFELCNKYGILVIQDCMFSSVTYPINNKFIENITHELSENIERIAHNPSLILIFGNNEIDMTYTMLTSDDPRTQNTRDFFEVPKITDSKIKKQMTAHYQKLFLETLPKIVQRVAPQIPYAHSSPNTKATYTSKSIFDYAHDGDFHYYLAYDGQAAYESIKNINARFISEMGFQSYPNIKTIKSFADTKSMSPNSSVMLSHQKCKDGNDIINNYMEAEFNIPERFTDYVYLSQVLAGIIMRYSIEHFRSINYYCSGVLIWQMNDCWPTISWSGVDYHGRWKAQQYFTKRFYEPILPIVNIEQNFVTITITNDSINTFKGTLKWHLKHHNNVLDSGEVHMSVNSNSNQQLIKLNFDYLTSDLLNEIHFEYLLYDNNEIIASNSELFVKPKSFQFKNPEITYTITDQNNQFIIELYTKQMAKYVELDLTDDDCIFSDNYFDLLHNYPKIITVDKNTISSELSIHDFEKQLCIKSLNMIGY